MKLTIVFIAILAIIFAIIGDVAGLGFLLGYYKEGILVLLAIGA